jgi:drug/metabolite transporter superfamily protein YnfA
MNGETEQAKAPIVTVPADLEIEDRLIGPFTARQAMILGVGAAGAYAVGSVLRPVAPLPALVVTGLVLTGLLLVFVTARRDGLTLERWTGLGATFVLRPKRCVAGEAVTDSSAASLARLAPTSAAFAEPGVLGLGPAGAAAIVECGTVNLALCSSAEARSTLISLGAVLNAIGGSFQMVALAYKIDLDAHAQYVEWDAAQLPRDALRTAAVDHARFLRHLAGDGMLIGRRVLLVLREQGEVSRAAVTLAARAAQTVQLLGSCGLSARQLTAAEAAGAVAAACDPQRGPAAESLDLAELRTEEDW